MTTAILPSGSIPVSCNRDCGGGCPLIAETAEGKVIQLKDNPLSPADMSGCIRGYRYADTLYHKDRLLRPLIREGERGSGQFREASWDEALDYAARGLDNLIGRFGANSILHLGGSGSCRGAVHNTSRLPKRFFSILGGYSGTDGNYSERAVRFVMPYMFGTELTGFDPAGLTESACILLWGANISDTRFGPNMEYWVRKAREKGAPVFVIDPRESRTVSRCGAEWIPVYPGTAAALMCALLQVLLETGNTDEEFLAAYCSGGAEIKKMVTGRTDGVVRTPEWAEAVCGVPAAEIRRLAGIYGTAKPAALIPGLSIQRTWGGEETSRLAVALQAFTGNIGRIGGSSGGKCWGSLPTPACGMIPALESEKTVKIPVYPWADWVLNGRAGGYPADVRGIYNAGGNYCIQGSDIRKNIRALLKPEFSLCHEMFLTATARYCDVVFPVSTFLERNDLVKNGLNYLLYSRRAVLPAGEVKDDYEIFALLAEKLGVGKAFTGGRSAEEWVEWCIENSEVENREEFVRTGIYDGGAHRRTAFSDFRRDPEAHPLATATGKIELSSRRYEEETGFSAVPLPRFTGEDPEHPLSLITPHARSRVNSQNGNIGWSAEMDGPEIGIHSRDAEARGLADGMTAEVTSATGSFSVRVKISDNVMPGVVAVAQGSWPASGPGGLEHADNPNFCTSAEPTMPSSGSRTHSTRVEVRVPRGEAVQ